MTNPAQMPWKQAWKVLPAWGRLHRVAVIEEAPSPEWSDAEMDAYEALICIDGVTCCGRRGKLMMPGIGSRMGLARCRACAKAAGVDPDLTGIPGNGGECGPRDAWQEAA